MRCSCCCRRWWGSTGCTRRWCRDGDVPGRPAQAGHLGVVTHLEGQRVGGRAVAAWLEQQRVSLSAELVGDLLAGDRVHRGLDLALRHARGEEVHVRAEAGLARQVNRRGDRGRGRPPGRWLPGRWLLGWWPASRRRPRPVRRTVPRRRARPRPGSRRDGGGGPDRSGSAPALSPSRFLSRWFLSQRCGGMSGSSAVRFCRRTSATALRPTASPTRGDGPPRSS